MEDLICSVCNCGGSFIFHSVLFTDMFSFNIFNIVTSAITTRVTGVQLESLMFTLDYLVPHPALPRLPVMVPQHPRKMTRSLRVLALLFLYFHSIILMLTSEINFSKSMCCVFLRHFRCVSSVGLAALPIQLLGFQRMSFKSMLKKWSFRISVSDGKRPLPRSRTRRPHGFRCNMTSAK